MDLPPPIQAFFTADKCLRRKAMLQAFAPKAEVRDEGQVHVGHSAIDAWWCKAKAAYQHVAEPLDCTLEDGEHHVRARVTGRFPGSPAILSFAFRLQGDRIAYLEIGA